MLDMDLLSFVMFNKCDSIFIHLSAIGGACRKKNKGPYGFTNPNNVPIRVVGWFH